jgi:protein-L-isoaspartate(D-aspartate) O-methyltransferase
MNAVSPHDAPQYVNMLLGQLFTNKINNPDLLGAMAEIPREAFVPAALRGAAYVDEDLEIAQGRYMLAPLNFARLLQLAELSPSCKVLVIGGANGYAAAVISQLVGSVVSIDSDPVLTAQAKLLKLANIEVQHVDNMAAGYSATAPYDAIFINGGVEELPTALAEQLVIGGRLVFIQQEHAHLGKGTVLKRMENQTSAREHFDASAPVLPGFNKTRQFEF